MARLAQVLDGNRSHHRIVGTEFHGRDMQFEAVRLGRLGQLMSKQLIGGHAAAHAQPLPARCVAGPASLTDQAIDHRLLKTGGQIRDLLGWQLQGGEVTLAHPGDAVAHGGLQAAEAEVQPIRILQKRAWQLIGLRVPVFSQLARWRGRRDRASPSMDATLSNASPAASSIVPPSSLEVGRRLAVVEARYGRR